MRSPILAVNYVVCVQFFRRKKKNKLILPPTRNQHGGMLHQIHRKINFQKIQALRKQSKKMGPSSFLSELRTLCTIPKDTKQ